MYCSYHDTSNEDANSTCTCDCTPSAPISVAQAETLILTNLGAMLTFIADQMIEPFILTYVAEDLRHVPDPHKQYTDKKYTVCDTLIGMLYHSSSVVREGALLGVDHFRCVHMQVHLVNIMFYDQSSTLRDTARDVLLRVTRGIHEL